MLGIDNPRRLSISEPVGGYAPYEKDANNMPVTYNASTGQYNATLDIPPDMQRSIAPTKSLLKETFQDTFATTNDLKKNARTDVLLGPATALGAIDIAVWLANNGTIPAFRILYLQRLADPTRPWATDQSGSPQQWNPYRTVDAMTVDLTTFSGLTTKPEVDGLPADKLSTYYPMHFEARQRGEKNWLTSNGTGSADDIDLWKQEPADKSNWMWDFKKQVGWTSGGSVPSSASQIFRSPLNQTLGYLNQRFGQPQANGDPQVPFPWMNWPYRPFNNEYELLLVPAVSSSRLLSHPVFELSTATKPPTNRRHFGFVDSVMRSNSDAKVTRTGGGGYTPANAFAEAPNPFPASGTTIINNAVPFPHLLNFFESTPANVKGTSAQYHRVLAYVGVPSKFANTQIQLRPDVAGANTSPHYFHTPYNRISRYREPGRINFNSITSPDVLLGALNMWFPPLQQNGQLYPQYWEMFVRSIRNDGSSGKQFIDGLPPSLEWMLRVTGTNPTKKLRPFRSPGGGYLAPPGIANPKTGKVASNTPPRELDVTLLRSDTALTGATELLGNSARPMLEMDDWLLYQMCMIKSNSTKNYAFTPGMPNGFSDNLGDNYACMDWNRNPYFRYQGIMKAGGVVSAQSNVFAIWITEGYFEVTPAAKPGATDAFGNLIYPDGYQLGQELGSDTGDTVRHRAFYIFDRSIPVGFIRGYDLNHDKAVLLKRFIE